MKKRLISMLLSAALFVTSIPMSVSADNQVNEGNASTAVSSEGNQGMKHRTLIRQANCRQRKILQRRDTSLADGMRMKILVGNALHP